VTLFIRTYRLVVGERDVSDLDISFQVTRTLAATPNKAQITVYNANADTRASWQKFGKKIPVLLEAGYKSTGNIQLFKGFLRTIQSTVEGSNIVTQIESGDGEEVKGKRVKVSMPAKVPPDQVLRAIVGSLGVGQGNLEDAVRVLRTRGLTSLHGRGATIVGPAARAMTELCDSAGLEWSVQDGAVQILEAGKALAGTAIDLSAGSGLYGSPTVDAKGVLTAQTALIPGLVPGRLVHVDSVGVKGFYVVGQVEYSGEVAGEDWGCEIRGKAQA
jgi:hypothetical protein